MKLNVNSILFNAGGFLVFAILGVYAFNSFFHEEGLSQCSARYDSSMHFNVQNATGRLMSPIELQAAIGREQRNIVRNAAVVPFRSAPGASAIMVTLERGTSSAYQLKVPEGGIAFNWKPGDLKGSTSACLRYSLRLDDKFDFAGGGMLPGLFGGKPLGLTETSDGKSGWSSRFVWGKDGKFGVFAQIPGTKGFNGRPFGFGKLKLDRGKWLALEQEVILNTPGKADGILRVWLDGELVIDQRRITWRLIDKLRVDGVMSEVSYGVVRGKSVAPKKAFVAMSPFVVSWQ